MGVPLVRGDCIAQGKQFTFVPDVQFCQVQALTDSQFPLFDWVLSSSWKGQEAVYGQMADKWVLDVPNGELQLVRYGIL